MSMPAATASKTTTEARPRRIAHRTRRHAHGPITRLVSPSDVGKLIKPFVFLDYFDIDPKRTPAIGFHPHSGIATLTLLLEGRISYVWLPIIHYPLTDRNIDPAHFTRSAHRGGSTPI